MSITNIDYKDLRRKLEARYFVQWITAFDSNNHITQVLGFCVRDRGNSGWPTVFKHREEDVCQKIADMLNEEGA